LARRGPLFLRDIQTALAAPGIGVAEALAELVSAGSVTADGFAGLRGLLRPRGEDARHAPARDASGRWSLLAASPQDGTGSDRDGVAAVAAALLHRYGVVFRRLAVHEGIEVPWRDLLREYRRLEARGEIRGGRFVTGVSGEQFASTDAVTRMREIRRHKPQGDVIVISAADPLNLAGVADASERIRRVAGTRVAYRDGVAVAVLEGEYLRPLVELDRESAAAVTHELVGRSLPVASGFVGRPR
jgi:ATP-dependent helicase Lhr and Lhr-like helicase